MDQNKLEPTFKNQLFNLLCNDAFIIIRHQEVQRRNTFQNEILHKLNKS